MKKIILIPAMILLMLSWMASPLQHVNNSMMMTTMLGLTFKQANTILNRIEQIDDVIGAAQLTFLVLGGAGALSYGVIWTAKKILIRYGKKEAVFW